MNTLKLKIKELSETQIELKNQRKTVKIVGTRTMEPWQAALSHSSNRENLRILFAAYGVLRGKTFNQIESCFPEENHPLNAFKISIDKLVAQYAETLRISE